MTKTKMGTRVRVISNCSTVGKIGIIYQYRKLPRKYPYFVKYDPPDGLGGDWYDADELEEVSNEVDS